MPGPEISKAGSAPLVKVGHTIGKNFGTNPNAKIRGSASEPTPISFGGNGR